MKFDFKNITQILGLTSIFNTDNNSATSLSIINNNTTTSLQAIGINSSSKMIFSEHNSDILNSIEEKLAIADKKYGYYNTAELDHLESAEDLAPSLQVLSSINNGAHKVANKASNHDVASICDNGVHKVLVCDKQAQLSTPEEFINKNCSIADGDTHYSSNDRFIFWDSNDNLKVTILEDSKLTFLYKEDNNIIKYVCIKWDEWFKSTMRIVAKHKDCNYTDYIKNFTSNEVKYCESGYPTPEDISLFSDNNNDAGNKDNNSFNTWKIAGIVGGATTLLGVVGASIYKIQSNKNKATHAKSQSQGISGEAEELISPQDLLNALQAKAGPGVTVVKTLKDAKELIEMPVHQEASPIYVNLSENSDFEDSDYEILCTGNHADYVIND